MSAFAYFSPIPDTRMPRATSQPGPPNICRPAQSSKAGTRSNAPATSLLTRIPPLPARVSSCVETSIPELALFVKKALASHANRSQPLNKTKGKLQFLRSKNWLRP